MPEFQFDGLADFLSMGGHGFYVWTSYVFFTVVMAMNLWLPHRQRTQLMRLLQARQLRQHEQGGAEERLREQQAAQQQQGHAK